MAVNDMRDSVAAALDSAGIAGVRTALGYIDEHSESVCVVMGIPGSAVRYIDGTRDVPLTVNVYVKRESEAAADMDACTVQDVLSYPIESIDGSYEAVDAEAGEPQPIEWDDGWYLRMVAARQTIRVRPTKE